MHTGSTKVLIISLDGATFDVLQPLIRQGYMPNLAGLLETGVAARLESVVPAVTAPAWSSFMTGKNPNKHGIFDFIRFDPQTADWKINNSRHILSKTIWQILSDNNKQVVVVGLPYTYPPYKVCGAMVSGWDAPAPTAFTYPAELEGTIFDLVPDYGSALDLSLWSYLPTDSDEGFEQFIRKLTTSCRQNTVIASHLLRANPWDVFMVHFQQTDWIQHKLWGYIERACRNEGETGWRFQRVRECYRVFDESVGELLRIAASVNPVRIVLSDHGFGPHRGTIYPSTLLYDLGLYRLQSEVDNPLKGAFKDSRYAAVRNLYRTLRRARNEVREKRKVKRFSNWAQMANESVVLEKVKVDWSRTKAVFMGGSETGFIYVNVKGRGPFGCVEEGAEYEDIVSTLITKFRDFKNPQTGDRLLTRVARGSEIYGPPSEGVLIPDVVLVPLEGYAVAGGLVDSFVTADGERGDHRHDGVISISGPGVHGQVSDLKPNLIDVAPTVLHMLDLPIPSDMDGRVLHEVFTERRAVRFVDADSSQPANLSEYADEESTLIEQRLRGLGYVE